MPAGYEVIVHASNATDTLVRHLSERLTLEAPQSCCYLEVRLATTLAVLATRDGVTAR
jgi:hypothetical protein